MNLDTIVAPATPHGIGGIAVVRLSGLQSLSMLRKLINNNTLAPIIKHRMATYVDIFDNRGLKIDGVVFTYFESPNSYTGEDVVEISCHGNPIIVEKIIITCIHFGARLAEPGEFTRRAFLNGKMDLIQAESVASLIHSKSVEGNALNLKILSGVLSEDLNFIRNNLIEAVSLIEFELDVSEDDLQPNLINQVSSIVLILNKKIEVLLGSFKQARLLNSGAIVVIVGEPNVGKSTLLNALSESDRAITSHLPGTTRDAIDVPLILGGVPINLIDTAGLRETAEAVEAEGVRRSIDYMKRADLIIAVKEIFTTSQKVIKLPDNVPVIETINKVDLISQKEIDNSKKMMKSPLLISAKTGEGLDELKRRIKQSLGISSSLSDTLSITTTRQQVALKKCQNNLEATTRLLDKNNISYELVSIELREALDSIGSILGQTTPEDILNNIFNHFCVGK